MSNRSSTPSGFETSPGAVRQTVYEARTALQAMSEGREMDCNAVRQALSDGDGRVLRRRAIRAHLKRNTQQQEEGSTT